MPESAGASIKSEAADVAASPRGATPEPTEAAVQEVESGEPNYWSILIGALEFGEPEEPARKEAAAPKEMKVTAQEERLKQVWAALRAGGLGLDAGAGRAGYARGSQGGSVQGARKCAG